MASSTALNESLACIALSYISINQNHSLEEFHQIITKTSGQNNLWPAIISKCEISNRSITSYREEYKDIKNNMNPWIQTSYNSAIEIENTLNLKGKLQDYIFSRVERNSNNSGFWLKNKATSAIKKHAKHSLENPGLLSTLNADKLNIADIFIIHAPQKKKNNLYKKIEKIVKNTDVPNKTLDDNKFQKKELLTVKLYKSLMEEAWKSGEIYSVSLKALDKNAKNIPVKLYNLPTSSSQTKLEKNQDRFALFLMNLIKKSKESGSNFSTFSSYLDKFVQIKPVVFTAADRLLVYFDLVYSSDIVKKYHIFTNFSTGNAIHFVPEGSKSASGEGGITINYFFTLTKNHPELKKFFKDLSDTRLRFFKNACKEYNVNPNDILGKMGSKSMSSGIYNSSLYLSKNYADLIDVMLGEKDIFKIGQVSRRGNSYYAKIYDKVEEIDEDTGEPKKNKKGKVITKLVVRDDFTDIKDGVPGKTYPIKILDIENLYVLQKFFQDYTGYLSNQKGSMGKFLGASESSKADIKKQINKVRKEIETITARQKDPKKKEIARRVAVTKVLQKTQFAKSTYKKSYALMTNAEFGFFFSSHQKIIEDILKKQVLLSFYAAASGRGYVIFDGKKFKEDDIFEKDVSPPPFLKVGM